MLVSFYQANMVVYKKWLALEGLCRDLVAPPPPSPLKGRRGKPLLPCRVGGEGGELQGPYKVPPRLTTVANHHVSLIKLNQLIKSSYRVLLKLFREPFMG